MNKASSGRIPSLDGLRAISIAFVLFGHLIGTGGFPIASSIGIDLAHLGVTVFFVISGFLITSLLMAEREKDGSVSLKRFYLRRVLRIFPAFYAFVAALLVARAVGWIDLSATDLTVAATYTANYYPYRSWNVGHLWSLSIEEQFYLLWPFVFVALRPKPAFIACMAAFFAAPIVRAAMHVAFPDPSPLRDLEIFPAMADSIAIGCAMALARPKLQTMGWYMRLTGNGWAMLALVPVILVVSRFADIYTAADLVGAPVMLAAIAILIESLTRHPETWCGRVLNLRPMIFVGVLSYSLYLWQQPFLNRHVTSLVTSFPVNLGLAVGCALLSYFLIERPLLGVRRKLERVPTGITA
jgi:peptidoglycan/LPS O-acetylase OafA/YrhL